MTRYLPPQASGDEPTGLPVFCFPFAGGGATAYSGWQRRLGPSVRVLPVRLPGREVRIAEPRFTDIDELVADLDEHLGPELERSPHLLFGHSMGAMIAYTLAHRRVRLGKRPPRALLLSAYRPPHLGVPRIFDTVAEVRTEDALMDTLTAIGGIPDQLLRHAGWMSMLLPIARDDLLLCSSVPRRPADPIPVPLHLFAGNDDTLVAPRDVAEWAGHGDAQSDLAVFPGGHFYLRDREAEFLGHLSGLLAPYAAEFEDALATTGSPSSRP